MAGSGVTGWALGYLRLPYLEKNHAFWAGVIACLAVVSLILVLLLLRKRSQYFFSDKNRQTGYSLLPWAVACIVATGISSGFLLILRQNASLKTQAKKQNEQVKEMSQFIASFRKNDHAVLANSLLKSAEDELKSNQTKILSDETIEKIIVALNHSLLPYLQWNEGSLSKNELSPGRAQVLLGIKTLHLDTASFDEIKKSGSFSQSDLRGADLKGFDLRGADLRKADLTHADLSNADLRGADLSEANMWGAKLNHAQMNSANLKRANLAWAQLNEADFTAATLDGADLSFAQLRNARLHTATLRWVTSGGALLHEADLRDADLIGADFTKANLSLANLSGANLGKTNLSEANFTGAQLDHAAVDAENWIEKLAEWRGIAAAEIQKAYTVESDTTKKYKESKYRLTKK